MREAAPAGPVVSAFFELWDTVSAGRSPGWRARTAHTWIDYLAGNLTERADRSAGTVLDFEAGLRVRRKTIGIRPSLELVGGPDDVEVPELAWQSSHLEAMRLATIDAVVFVNEVFSLENDEARGDPNLVVSLTHEHRLDRSAAIDLLVERTLQRIASFEALAETLPRLCGRLGLPPAEQDAVTGYAAAMRHWIRGNYDWSRVNGRYSGRTAAQIAPDLPGHLNTEDLSAPARHPQ